MKTGARTIVEIPVADIAADPGQPRRQFIHKDLQELAESIKKDGLMQPITVRPREGGGYIIIAGERRWRAHQLAELPTIRAMVDDAADLLRIRTLSIVENLHRKDLNVIEESDSLAELQRERGLDDEGLAKIIGKPWTFVRDRLKLQKLGPQMREGVIHGTISPAAALHMSKLNHSNQLAAFDKIATTNANHWWLLVDSMLQIEQQGALFNLGNPEERKRKQAISSKYDDMIAKVEQLVCRSFKSDELSVLSSVLDGDTAARAERIELIMAHLRRIQDALRRAKATQETVDLFTQPIDNGSASA